MASNSAIAKVLGTTELLESIILHAPLKDILLLQRISKSWQATIATSIRVQKALGLVSSKDGRTKPVQSPEQALSIIRNSEPKSLFYEQMEPQESSDTNPWVKVSMASSISTHDILLHSSKNSAVHINPLLEVVIFQSAPGPPYESSYLKYDIGKFYNMRRLSCLEEIFATFPTMTELTIHHVWISSMRSSCIFDEEGEVQRDTGITVADIVDYFKSTIDSRTAVVHSLRIFGRYEEAT